MNDNDNDTPNDTSYEELLAKITHPKQRLFLENFPKFRTLTPTEAAIGMAPRSVYNWIEDDEVFNEAYEALKKQISRELILLHEQNIDNVAFGEKTPAQSRIFGSLVRLRAEAPEKYREKYTPEFKLSGDITVKMAIPGYSDEPLQEEAGKLLKEGKHALQGQGITEGSDKEGGSEA